MPGTSRPANSGPKERSTWTAGILCGDRFSRRNLSNTRLSRIAVAVPLQIAVDRRDNTQTVVRRAEGAFLPTAEAGGFLRCAPRGVGA